MKNVKNSISQIISVEFNNYVNNTASITDYIPTTQEQYKQIGPIILIKGVCYKLRKNKKK
jgi:hypothetical protein